MRSADWLGDWRRQIRKKMYRCSNLRLRRNGGLRNIVSYNRRVRAYADNACRIHDSPYTIIGRIHIRGNPFGSRLLRARNSWDRIRTSSSWTRTYRMNPEKCIFALKISHRNLIARKKLIRKCCHKLIFSEIFYILRDSNFFSSIHKIIS